MLERKYLSGEVAAFLLGMLYVMVLFVWNRFDASGIATAIFVATSVAFCIAWLKIVIGKPKWLFQNMRGNVGLRTAFVRNLIFMSGVVIAYGAFSVSAYLPNQ